MQIGSKFLHEDYFYQTVYNLILANNLCQSEENDILWFKTFNARVDEIV